MADRDRKNAANDRTSLLQQNSQLIQFAQTQATKDDMLRIDKDIQIGSVRIEEAIKGVKAAPFPPSPLPAPTVEHTIFTSRRAPSTDPNLPYGLQIIIQSDVTISPVAFAIECTGEVGKVDAFISGHGSYMDIFIGPNPNNKNVAIVKFSFPSLVPESPLVVTILSKEDIRVKQVAKFNP